MAGLWRHLARVGALAAIGLASAASAPAQERAEDAGGAQELIERLRAVAEEIRREGRAATPSEAAPAMPPGALDADEVRSRVAEELGVEVLDVMAVELDGTPAWAVKVMNPPGNSNAAFMVQTLIADAETGEILGRAPEFPTFSEGVPAVIVPNVDSSGPELRRRTYR